MKEFWQFEGPAPAVPEGVWEVPEGLPIAPGKTFAGQHGGSRGAGPQGSP